MFEKLNEDDLKKLTLVTEGPCISLYFQKIDEYCLPEEFEAIVRRVEKLLSYKPHPDNEILLRNLYDFNPEEYIHSKDFGIAIFINRHWAGYYLAGHKISDKVIVAESFHLKPLLGDMQKIDQAYALTITREEGSLLYINGETGQELQTFLFHFGQNSNSLHWSKDDDSDTLNFPHVKNISRSRGGKKGSLNRKIDYLKSFLHILESRINKETNYKDLPLLVFTNEQIFSVYKSVTTHPSPLLIKQDESKTSLRQDSIIHQAHLQLMQTKDERRKEFLRLAEEKFRDHKVIDDLKKINRAALDGKVRTLFLQKKSEIRGEVNRRTKLIQFADDEYSILKKRISEDILDDIACEVIKHGGEVIVVNKDQMPSSGPAAAILNF